MAIILTLCLLGFLAYSNSFHNSFHFDDFPQIVNNAAIKDIHHLCNIWSCLPTRFIAFFSFALNYHWGGLDVCGYHIFSLLVHVGTSILVWRLILLTFNTPVMRTEASSAYASWIAFFTAAIFLTHPLQTQAVNYIYQRSVLLVAFFYIASLVLYIKAHLAWEAKLGAKGQFYYGGSLLCAVLSMFSKENAISLPFMIFFYQWFFLRGDKVFHWKRTVPFFLVILILPLTWGLLNFQTLTGLNKAAANYVQARMSVGQYALTQAKVIVTYLKLLVLPFHQRVEYDFTAVSSFFEIPVLCSIFFLSLILGVAVKLRNRFRLVSFGIFWFFITMMPESSIFPNRDLAYEHRLYLPLLGFAVFLSSGSFYLLRAQKAFLGFGVLFVLVTGYSFLTYERNKVWLNDFTLWDDAARRSPNSSRVFLNRGAAYQAKGDLDHAFQDYNMAIGLGNTDVVTFSNRGLIFEQKGNFDLALADFNLAVKINSSYTGTYFNRGLLYKKEGRFDLAAADFSRALAQHPDDTILYELRAETYFLNKEYDKAWADIHTIERLGVKGQAPFLRDLIKVSGKR